MQAMQLMDARVRGAGSTSVDMENLRFFGMSGIVLSPPAYPAATVEEVLGRFHALLGEERRRATAAGLSVWVMLGVHPCWAPRRDVHQILHRLPELLRREGVVGVGELGLLDGTPPELDLLHRQLEAAGDAGLPVVLHFPGGDGYRLTALALDALLEVGFPPGRALVAGVSAETLELVQAAGARAGVTLGGEPLGRAVGVGLLRQAGPSDAIVDGGLGDGACDLLAIPKAAEELLAGGWSEDDIGRVMRDNAAKFFGVAPLLVADPVT